MIRDRNIRPGTFWTVIALFVVLCTVLVIYTNRRSRMLNRKVQIMTDLVNYTQALNAYSNHFGILPVGDNAAVTSVLTGNNEQHLTFLQLGARSKLNQRGEFLDPIAHPYDIKVTTNQFRIIRPSP